MKALEIRFTIPDGGEQVVFIDQPTMTIGALLSNQVVIRAPGVEPIHGLIEEVGDDLVVTDLGSEMGIKVNGTHIDVEGKIQENDTITIGSIDLKICAYEEPKDEVPAPPVPPAVTGPGTAIADSQSLHAETAHSPEPSHQPQQIPQTTNDVLKSTAIAMPENDFGRRHKDILFSPRDAKPTGDVLEVVAYWGDTVLEVGLFHETSKGFESVTIGDPTKSHLIAAGKSHFDSFTMVQLKSEGYKLNLHDGMKGRLRRSGKVENVENQGSYSMGKRDIAHVKYGAVRYFMMFVRPPRVTIKKKKRDPLFMALASVAALVYLTVVPVVWMYGGTDEEKEKDDFWSIIYLPEKDKKVEPIKQPKLKQEKIAQVKKAPDKPKPPKPTQKPKAAKPIETKKVTQPKPVEKPVEKPKPTESLARNNKPKNQGAKPQEAKPSENKAKASGMPSIGSKSPDFKLAGPKLSNTRLGRAGGPKGGGLNQRGGARKGTGKASFKGVEGVNNNKASGVNLSKLGLGVGKVLNKAGPGGVKTNFKNSAGGAGGGMGSASKTYGLGGVGTGKSLGLAGGGGANNFGAGAGGFLSGEGGSGGRGGAGLGKAFGAGGRGGRGRANVTVPPGDPVVSGGLTPQEIMAVIRANLNQIRHCYEKLLQRSPNQSGKIAVKFVVGASGRVSTVAVTNSDISDSMMRGCVTGRIQRWKFPAPRGGQPVTVNYPFLFTPL